MSEDGLIKRTNSAAVKWLYANTDKDVGYEPVPVIREVRRPRSLHDLARTAAAAVTASPVALADTVLEFLLYDRGLSPTPAVLHLASTRRDEQLFEQLGLGPAVLAFLAARLPGGRARRDHVAVGQRWEHQPAAVAFAPCPRALGGLARSVVCVRLEPIADHEAVVGMLEFWYVELRELLRLAGFARPLELSGIFHALPRTTVEGA